MPTLKTVAEIAIDKLNGGRATQSTWDLRTIMFELGFICDSMLPDYVRKNYIEDGVGGIDNDMLESYYDIEIKYNESLALYYSTMPVQYVALPFDMGVYHLSPMKNQDNPYVPVSPQFRSAGENEIFDISHLFWFEKQTIFYNQWEDTGMKMLLKMIPSFSLGSNLEEREIPADLAKICLDELMRRYGQPIPQDTYNDGRNRA